MPSIPLTSAAPAGQERAYVDDVIAGQLTGTKYTSLCERWLENALGARRVLLTPSATSALEMSALLLDIAPGDEIIMPSFTFVSTASAYALRGGVPVFVDIHPDTLNIDEAKIAAAVTPRTRAIVVVHYAGNACAMAAIRTLARRHNLDIVEDAAHGLLSEYRSRSLGTIGRFGALSFHGTKNITCGEGGALLINDVRDVARAEILHEKGTDRAQFLRGDVQKYSWVDLGSSYAVSELCSAFLYGQLERARAVTERRLALCAAYRAALTPLAEAGFIRLPPQLEQQRSNGHIFYVLTADPGIRNRLLDHLKQRGIESAFHFIPLHSSVAGMRHGRTAGPMPVTEQIAATLLRLPLFAAMTNAQVGQVCDAVHGFYLQQPVRTVS